VKHQRIGKFLSSIYLSPNQRELVKFMQPYTLYTRRPEKILRHQSENETSVQSDKDTIVSETDIFFGGMLNFNPDEDPIDSKLQMQILDRDDRQEGSFITPRLQNDTP
jgi:hypothetical protein